MEELRDLVTTPSAAFSADLAAWLSPPQRPRRAVSHRHRTGLRNSVAFGLVCLIVFAVAFFALSGSAPSQPFTFVAAIIALVVGGRNWMTESKLAAQEDSLLLEAHRERHTAFLQRTRIWSRLRHCPSCGLVVDPVTLQSASVFDVHELANGRVGTPIAI
jgi:hypothetical protein